MNVTVLGDWGHEGEDIIPGHECVGRITALGSAVSKEGLHPGAWVGVGYQGDSCASCEWCRASKENVCSEMRPLFDTEHKGAFATALVAKAHFVMPLPEALTKDKATLQASAPLLCGGVTTYAPLARALKHRNGASTKVGVVGIGGLGHMGLQFAKSLGKETIAISRSYDKREAAMQLGATSMIASSDEDAMKEAQGTLDVILCTVSANYDPSEYLQLLKPLGEFIIVGAPPVSKTLEFKPFDVIFGEKSIRGSLIGGTEALAATLEFSAEHGVGAQVELLPLDQAQKAMDGLREGKPRFRYVLDVEAFKRERGLDLAYFCWQE